MGHEKGILIFALVFCTFEVQAAPTFDALCRITSCSQIGPARNGGCSRSFKLFKIHAHYTVNTLMEGEISVYMEGQWYPSNPIKGGWGHEAVEFEPFNTSFPNYVFIPTKTDAAGKIEMDPTKAGYVLMRPANFGAVFEKYVVYCQEGP